MKPAAIFFDMDGLFIDSEPIWLSQERALMAKFGYEWTLSDQRNCLGGPLSRIGIYMQERANEERGPQYFVDQLVDAVAAGLRNNVSAMPGAISLAQRLKSEGFKLALVSASPRVVVDAGLVGLKEELFDFSISADDVGQTKPNPEPYLTAATNLGVDIKNCLIFEDSITGVTAAKASGAYVVAVPHLVTIEPAARVKIISSLTEVDQSFIDGLDK